MVALLASPQKYIGKRIRMQGFLHLEFEGNALYLHEEDYRYALTGNACYLGLSKVQERKFAALNHKYVLIEGTASGRLDLYDAHITNVTRVEPLPPNGPR